MAVARFTKLPLYLQVIAAVLLGSALGALFGKAPYFFGWGNEELGELGLLVIRVLKALAVPLVLFAILDAFLKTRLSAKSGGKLVLICLLNVSVAFAIGLTLMNTVKPGLKAGPALQRVMEEKGANATAPKEQLSLLDAI